MNAPAYFPIARPSKGDELRRDPLAWLDALDAELARECAEFVAAHDNVLAARSVWRGALHEYYVTIDMGGYTTVGIGETLEDALTNDGGADAAVFGLVRALVS